MEGALFDKLLIVENDQAVREMLGGAVKEFGIASEVISSDNAKEAWEKVKSEKPDAVVSDIDLPGNSGLDLAKNIRKKFPGIKIVLMSGLESKRNIGKEGFVFLEKPFKLTALYRAFG